MEPSRVGAGGGREAAWTHLTASEQAVRVAVEESQWKERACCDSPDTSFCQWVSLLVSSIILVYLWPHLGDGDHGLSCFCPWWGALNSEAKNLSEEGSQPGQGAGGKAEALSLVLEVCREHNLQEKKSHPCYLALLTAWVPRSSLLVKTKNKKKNQKEL